MLLCYICKNSFYNIISFKRHCNDNYSNFSINKWYCPFINCNRFFSIKISLFKHLDTHNETNNIVNRQLNELPHPQNNTSLDVPIERNENYQRIEIDEMRLSFLKTVLTILSDTSIARSKAIEIIKKAHLHSLSIINSIRDTQNKFLQFYSESDIDQLNGLYDYASNCVPSEYTVFKEIKKLHVYIPTKVHTLEVEGSINYEMGNTVLDEIPFTMTVVLLRSLFEKLFQIPTYFQLILDFINSLDQNTKNISNIMQTNFWKSKVSNFNEDKTLFVPLLVYFDDFETLNPLGSKSGLYKIGGVYVKLMCLPLSVQSQLLHIYSAMLFFTEDRHLFSDKVMFTPLIDELNYLQNVGIKICNEHYDQVKIIPILICGDNLGLNGILSFTECFAANFWCRFCTFSNKTLKTLTLKDNPAMYRTKDNYILHVNMNNLSLTGVKENSVFNSLCNFHVTENFCVDFAHDFLEGSCQIDMCNIIYNLIHKYEWFSLQQLNSKIKNFNTSFKRSNKLGIITAKMLKKNKIKASAIEMLNFVETFPLIISDLILDDTINEWVLYLILRDIMSILMAETINEEEIELIKCLIKEHHELYLNCFDKMLKPKHHLMSHYPLVLSTIGPVMQVWTLRFESFHQTIKQTAKMSRNRVNLLKSFAIKNELRNANLLLNHDFKENNVIKGKHKQIGVDSSKYTYLGVFNFENATKVSFVQLNNVKYKQDLCIQLSNGELPTFGLIKEVFILEEDIFLGCQILSSYGFNRTLYSLSIHIEDSFQVVPLHNTFQSHILYSLHKCLNFITIVRVR